MIGRFAVKLKLLIKTVLLVQILTFCSLVYAEENRSGLLFEATFDKYSTTADFARGNTTCLSFDNSDLQLRMFGGVGGTLNAICMSNKECCTYRLGKNFSPERGTVSLWVNPQNWSPGTKKWQYFFVIFEKGFHLTLGKRWNRSTLHGYLKTGDQYPFETDVSIKDSDWRPGKWHKLDLTWDIKKGITLYLDGAATVVPRGRYQDQLVQSIPGGGVRPVNVERIPQLDKGVFHIGMVPSRRKSHATNQNDITAYDEVRIYNRELSVSEIKDAYEKYYPTTFGKERLRNIALVPLVESRIVTDGVIDEVEWSDAAVFPLEAGKEEGSPGLHNQAYLKRDAENLYVAFCTSLPAQTQGKYLNHDDDVWNESSFEFILQPEKDIYRFVVSSSGILYDARNGDKKWNGDNIRTFAKTAEKGWSAELTIPLQSINLKKNQTSVNAQLCLNSGVEMAGDKTGRFSWSNTDDRLDAEDDFGTLLLGKDGTAVRLENICILPEGKLEIMAGTVPAPAMDRITLTAEHQRDGPDAPAVLALSSGNLLKKELSEGQQKILIKGVDASGKIVFTYEKFFSIDRPLGVTYTCWVKRKYIEVRANINNAGEKILQTAEKSGIAGEVTLVDVNGEERSSAKFTAREPVTEIRLPLPEELPVGTAKIRVTLGKMSRSVDFGVPDMTPYMERVAVDHSVPVPWTEVKLSSNNEIEVLGRKYIFNGSPFPAQIICRDEALMTEPITIRVEGAPVKWSSCQIVDQKPDVVTLAGAGRCGKFKLQWKGELWFDGLYKIEWQLDGKVGTKIKSLTMDWSVGKKYGEFVLNPLCKTWDKDRVKLDPMPPGYVRDFSIVWLTGQLRGLMWWTESEANWSYKKKEKPILVTRDDKNVSVKMDIISVPSTLQGTAKYTMAFMATPPKDPPAAARVFKWGHHTSKLPGTHGSTGWCTFRNELKAMDTTSPASMVPRDPQAYKEELQDYKRRGVVPYPYCMPLQLKSGTPDMDYFGKTWEQFPFYYHAYKKGGVPYFLQRCCGNTGAADLGAWRVNDLFTKYPELGGLYLDVGSSGYCENREHGHGGVDAFGKSYISSAALTMRSYLIRLYKLHKKYGKTFVYHCHSYFNPVCHTFVDYAYPGESYYGLIAKNYEHAYCEEISTDVYRSELNRLNKGFGILFHFQYTRMTASRPNLRHLKEDAKRPEMAIRAITPSLVHDVNVTVVGVNIPTVEKWWILRDNIKLVDAEFTGYWQSPGVTSASEKILASVYNWKTPSPWKKLIIVANMGRNEQAVGLSLDAKKLGLTGNEIFRELWLDKPVTKEELTTFKLAGNHFMLIGIKD